MKFILFKESDESIGFAKPKCQSGWIKWRSWYCSDEMMKLKAVPNPSASPVNQNWSWWPSLEGKPDRMNIWIHWPYQPSPTKWWNQMMQCLKWIDKALASRVSGPAYWNWIFENKSEKLSAGQVGRPAQSSMNVKVVGCSKHYDQPISMKM